jgi:hypothetical protein
MTMLWRNHDRGFRFHAAAPEFGFISLKGWRGTILMNKR